MQLSLGNLIVHGLFGLLTASAGITGTPKYALLAVFMLLCAAAGYFLGSINPAIMVSRKLYGKDIRECGSGNAGMTNMFRVYGKKAGFLTLAGDAAKTVAAVMFGYLLLGDVPFLFTAAQTDFGKTGAYLAGLFCVIGHMYPVYYGYRGGKGVLVAAVMLLFTDWPVFLLSVLVFAIVLVGGRMVSLASVMAAMLMPVFVREWYAVWYSGSEAAGFGGIAAVVIAVLVALKHLPNIKRIYSGGEPKITLPWQKKRQEAAESAETDAEAADISVKKHKNGNKSGKRK